MSSTIPSMFGSVKVHCVKQSSLRRCLFSTWYKYSTRASLGSSCDILRQKSGVTANDGTLFPKEKFGYTFRSNSSSDKGNHDLFFKQMMELKKEQDELFGDSNVNSDSNILQDCANLGNDDDLMNLAKKAQHIDQQRQNLQQNNPFEEEEDWEALSEEREALYDFSKEEKDAWSNNSNTEGAGKVLSSSLMESIRAAREAQALYDDLQLQKSNVKRQTWIEDTVAKYDSNSNSMQQTQQHSSSEIDNHNVFTHLNKSGESVSMVDVGAKVSTKRIARARSTVVFPPEVMKAFNLVTDDTSEKKHTEVIGPKGPIFATAKIAGIMGAKRTSEFIPLCHPLPLEKVDVDIVLEGNKAIIECECRVTHKTGVEMEALQGATIAALTIYDMVKAVSHRVQIEKTELITKSGGKRNIGPE